MTTPFDFLETINSTKVDLMKEDPANIKSYSPFMVNRGLSYFPDTIMFANEMNKSYHLPVEMQYNFYLNGIPKRKRFSKWAKKDSVSKDVKLIAQVYGYSEEKALIALSLLTTEQLKEIKALYDTGGK